MQKSLYLKSGFLALGLALSVGTAPGCNNDDGPTKQTADPGQKESGSNTDQSAGTDTETDTDKDDESGDECTSAADCQIGACQESASCENGYCQYIVKEGGTECDDNNLCTENDQCNAQGECVGTAMVCNEAPADACDADNDKYLTYNSTGSCQVLNNDAQCVYTYTESDCAGDCEANCASKCATVTCEQDDSCYNIACDPSGEGSGTALCTQGALKTAGSSCKIVTGATGLCTAEGVCVECLANTDCSTNETCNSSNQCEEVQVEPECTAPVCQDGQLTPCTDGKLGTPTTCENGCNTDGTACAAAQEDDTDTCTASICSNGKMKHCQYNKDLQANVYSEEIDCGNYGCNTAGNACNFYCTFQHLEADSQNSAIAVGYGRTEKSVTLTGGGTYCTADLTKTVSSWTYDAKPTVNNADANGTTEWISSNSKLATDTDLYCTFIARVNYTTVSGETYGNVRYICPVGDHNQTSQLGDAILQDISTTLTADQTRTIKLAQQEQTKPEVTYDNVEKFTNIDGLSGFTGTGYASLSFTSSDVSGITWAFTSGRSAANTDKGTYAIDSEGLLLKAGQVSTTVKSGVGTVYADLLGAFTSTSARKVEMYIDDAASACASVSVGAKESSFITCDVNKSGEVKIAIKVASGSVTIDNISWTNYGN